jgi:alkylhydroperoxidase/carboxymuconolactone decarboxylase family protein YurZ
LGLAGGRGGVVDYRQRLRRMAINEQGVVESEAGLSELGVLDPKTLALARLAALVAIGGAGPSFGEQATAAVSAGASADELVDVIVGVASIVGVPRVVAAAPRLALALGFDVEDSVD